MKFKLRELARKDLNIINSWRNDKDLISYLGANYRYIDLEIDVAWFDNYLKERNRTVRCSIVDESDTIIGLISLTNIDYINSSAELHIMIGNMANREKGIGQFAILEILNHAFNNLNLHKVELQVLCTNKRAIHVYEKVGFKQDGILRDACFKNGEYLDMIVMSILKDEFSLKKEGLYE